MKKLKFFTLLVGFLSFFSINSYASHHFEGAAFIKDTRLAQVDNYIFPSKAKDHTTVIMTVNYDPKKGKNGIFSPDAIYNIHLSSDLSLTKGKTISVKFNGDQYKVYQLDNPNPTAGTLGKEIGSGSLYKNGVTNNKIKVFAGATEDPFFGNAISLETFRQQNLEGKYEQKMWAEAENNNVFLDRKVGAIVLDIPNALLGEDVVAFFTTDEVKNKKATQVQYSALPLFSHVMLFDSNILKKTHNESRPTEEYSKDLANLVSARILRAVTIAKSDKDNPIEYADKTAKKLLPDVLTYKIGTDTSYDVNRINGRGLDEDIMATMLTFLLSEPTDHKIANAKKHTDQFPYLIPAKLN